MPLHCASLVQALTRAHPAALVDHFRRAVAADPMHLVAALNLAEVLTAVGDRELAMSCAGKVLAALDIEEVASLVVEDLARAVRRLWAEGSVPVIFQPGKTSAATRVRFPMPQPKSSSAPPGSGE